MFKKISSFATLKNVLPRLLPGFISILATLTTITLILPFHHITIARAADTCDITTSTGNGDISLELLLYQSTSIDPSEPEKGQTIITFEDCNALSLEDLSLIPPYGEFPYGFWSIQIRLAPEFDPNIHTIMMKIYFPGPINPLNAHYWALEYDTDDERIEWKEYYDQERNQKLFLANVSDHSISIPLKNLESLEHPGDFVLGIGDRDPDPNIIDHVGGLLWPIPYPGRCFIVGLFTLSGKNPGQHNLIDHRLFFPPHLQTCGRGMKDQETVFFLKDIP